MTAEDPKGIRLQKVLAQAGVASRRAAEELISQGRVEVDGVVVTAQGLRVDPAVAVVKVDGARIPVAPGHEYLALNKPLGVVSTMSDPQGRPTLAEYVPSAGFFHVGRLDADTSGLLLLTNDGEFAQRVAHPSHEVEKTYLAEVRGEVSEATVRKLNAGIRLEDGPVRPKVRLVQHSKGRSLLQVTLHEGRNRIVRRLLEAVGHPVRALTRTAVGPVRLGRLRPGQSRPLTAAELGEFLELIGM
ncbi:MAG: rRNA pseudouridine synthase [Propionibacteriaceae bacterium]|nr:rRNA pseudouridine synthase [Propionibacteriaceae bacterium]